MPTTLGTNRLSGPGTLEEGPCLAVDPVQILENYNQRLHLALAQQQALAGIQNAAAALERVHPRPI